VVKIISKRSIGQQPVYDIGLSRDHNFILTNGLVASNCFNKSHSAAYGYVTYQTAYLKANYPVEYMAALLSVNSGQQDKVKRYIDNCTSMGIQVEPPDINTSGVDFTPTGQRILFGLAAIRNLGDGAVESILEMRSKDGPFKSLADLCDRIDPRSANKKSFEALIHSGALDRLDPGNNRKQLAADLPFVVDWAQSRAKDRESGQQNIFDLFGGNNAHSTKFDTVPKAPATPDYSRDEKLRLEKEILGLYVSDHPLKDIQQTARLLAPINLGELGDCEEKASVSSIAIITAIKPVVTKKGDKMAILQLEDLTGQSEAVVFPKSFERIGHLLVADARLMFWGKVDRRDEQNQFIVDDAEPIDEVHLVLVEVEARQASDIQFQHRLKSILLDQRTEEGKPGKVSIVAVINSMGKQHMVRLGSQFRVADPQSAVEALNAAQFQAHSASLVSS
jgi:DNA polymerase III subunit alpha